MGDIVLNGNVFDNYVPDVYVFDGNGLTSNI